MKPSMTSSLLAAALAAAVGGGCLNLKPQPDSTRFYVLAGPDVEAAPPASNPAEGVPLFIGRVEIPEYLQTPAFALRVDETEIHFSKDHHWAEPLREGVTRVLRDALAAETGPDRMHPAMFRRPGTAYVEVQVALTEFECRADGSAGAAARWSLLLQPGSQPLAAGDFRVRQSFVWEPNDYRPAVAALSRCLVDLSRAIAPSVPQTVGPQG